MKKSIKGCLALLLAVALSAAVGCQQEKEKTIPVRPDNKQATEASAPEHSDEGKEEEKSDLSDEILTELYMALEDGQAFCAVAYLGYMEGEDYGEWLEDNGLLTFYPFLKEIPAERIIEQEGEELYCIIPRQDAALLSVYSQNFDSDGKVSAGAVLYQSSGCEPFLIRGNRSEIVPNTVVKIEYEDGSHIQFSPALSGENGHLAMEEGQGILDISLYLYQDISLTQAIYWDEEDIEGTWTCHSLSNEEGQSLVMDLEFYQEETKQVVLCYGLDYDTIIARYEGTYYASDIPSDPPQIMLELTLVDGFLLEEQGGQNLRSVVNLQYWFMDDGLTVTHLEGDPLLPGLEEISTYFTRAFG